MPHHRQPCSPAVTQESEPNFVRERGEEGGLKSDKSILEIGYISGSEHTGENLTETERSTKSTQTDIYIYIYSNSPLETRSCRVWISTSLYFVPHRYQPSAYFFFPLRIIGLHGCFCYKVSEPQQSIPSKPQIKITTSLELINRAILKIELLGVYNSDIFFFRNVIIFIRYKSGSFRSGSGSIQGVPKIGGTE